MAKVYPEYETLVAVHRVTEWRDGETYMTEFVEKRWVMMGLKRNPLDTDELYCSISTTDPDIHTLPRRAKS